MADSYHKVVAVISQAPEMRTDRDVTMLSSWFRKKSDLFRDLADAILHDLVRHCRFQPFKENDVIIRQGDIGDSFFTILSGSVGIYVANDDDGEGPNHIDDDSPRHGGGSNASLGAYIRSLGSGKSFGEVALIDSANRRGASVVAEEESDMIVVDRNLYTRSLKAAQKRDLEERIAFVESHPLFGKWKPKYKNYMAMGIARKIYRYGNHIAQQGDVIKKVNSFLSGTALVTVDRKMKNATEHAQLDSRSADVKASRRSRRENKSARVDSMVEICLIGQRAITGDIEAVCGLSKHTHTITCVGPVHTYEMEMRSFHKLVMRRHLQTVEKLRAMVVYKIQNRWERVRDRKVPIYRTILEKLLLHELRQDDGGIHTDVQTNTSMLSRRLATNSQGPGSLHRKLKKTQERRMFLSRRQSQLFPGFGDAQKGGKTLSSRASTRKNIRICHSAKDASQETSDPSVRHSKPSIGAAPGLTTGHNLQEEVKREDITGRRIKDGDSRKDIKERISPTKIKWILPEDAQRINNPEESNVNNGTDDGSSARLGSGSLTGSAERKKVVGDELELGTEGPRGISDVKLPALAPDTRDTKHQRTVFVTERVLVTKQTSASSSSSSQRLEQRSELDQDVSEDRKASRVSHSDANGDVSESTNDNDNISDSEYDNEVFEESENENDNDTTYDVTSEGETLQTSNDDRTLSSKKKRSTITRMSSDSWSALDQEDLLQLAYETYVSVSSEIKKFLVKVIDDAKRYEGSHPAGLESRLRPINTKLPMFLDKQRDGIGREATSMSLGRGHEVVKHASSSQQQSPMQRQKQQLEATSKTTRGCGRQRSKSEGETEQLIRSTEIETSTKLPSIQQHQSGTAKTFHQISREEQKAREAAPSALDLIYRQFGAVKKLKPRRQYTEEEYRQLKDMLRTQQKRYYRYHINL
eukprot:XP_011678869.1 PREDICTED: uncharacterized protein LOC100892767 [Strongylocentrotus purpuratus]